MTPQTKTVNTVDIDQHLFNQLIAIKRKLSEKNLSPSKTEEIITAHILNAWFQQKNLPYTIAVATNPTGYDGLLKVHGEVPQGQTMAVEFKSAKKQGQGNCDFQFNPDTFHFQEHACIACTEFTDGLPTRIFVALAPKGSRECMKRLREVLLYDGKARPGSYKKEVRANLRLFSQTKAAGDAFAFEVPGLEQLPYEWEAGADFIAVLDAATIQRYLPA